MISFSDIHAYFLEVVQQSTTISLMPRKFDEGELQARQDRVGYFRHETGRTGKFN